VIGFVALIAVIGYFTEETSVENNPGEGVVAPPENPPVEPPPARSKLETPTIHILIPTGDDKIKVFFGASISNASNYKIEYTTDQTFRTGVRVIDSATSPAEITGLNVNNTYLVRVKATGTGYSDSDYSQWESAKTVTIRPSSPTLRTVEPTGGTGIRATWDQVNNASEYRVQCATNSAFTTGLRTVNSANTWADLTGLSPNTTYYVHVMALGAGGDSEYSAVRSIILPPAPNTPVNLKEALKTSGYDYWLREFVRNGNTTLKNNLDEAERDFYRADGFGKAEAQAKVNAAKAAIAREQAAIARKTFVGEYTYSASNEKVAGNRSSFTMTIPTEFFPRTFNERNVVFPMGGITFGPGATSPVERIVLAVHGNTDDMRELFRNGNNYLVRVWFTNLRYNYRDYRIEANVQKVEIVRK